jgi:hypothetical protein
MEINIDSIRKIEEIQAEFNQKFPYLKMVFYTPETLQTRDFSNQNQIHELNLELGEIYPLDDDGYANINGHVKVSTLENWMEQQFGIPIQIYRKSRNLWIQTIETNQWTLSEQNRHGQEMDRKIEVSELEIDQFREQS